MVAYRFEDSRGGECVERNLAGFVGILQVDGSAAYNRLARPVGANEGVARETFDTGAWSVIRLCLHSRSHSARRLSLERNAGAIHRDKSPGDIIEHTRLRGTTYRLTSQRFLQAFESSWVDCDRHPDSATAPR